jgi:hypothetical protein
MRKLFVCAVTAVLMTTLPVYAQTGGMNNSAGGTSGGSIPGSMGSGTGSNTTSGTTGSDSNSTRNGASGSAMETRCQTVRCQAAVRSAGAARKWATAQTRETVDPARWVAVVRAARRVQVAWGRVWVVKRNSEKYLG